MSDDAGPTEPERRLLELEIRADKLLKQFQKRAPRLSDVKWAVSLIALVILGVIGLAQLSLNKDKERLDVNFSELRKELKAEIAQERLGREKLETDLRQKIEGNVGNATLKFLTLDGRDLEKSNYIW